jgi:hypothetical protein
VAIEFWQQVGTLEQGQGQTAFKTRLQSPIPGISGNIWADNPWDVVYLDDAPMPGICDVAGLARLRLDDKKAKGQNGSVLTIQGYQPGPFDIVCTIWTPEQFEILCNLIDNIWNIPRADASSRKELTKKLRKAHTVSHPKLDLYKIAFCEVQEVAFPEDGSEQGTKVFKFKCKEVKPPQKTNATKTPKATGPTRIPEYQDKDRPANLAPAAPSKNPKNLRPGGPPAAAASGE